MKIIKEKIADITYDGQKLTKILLTKISAD